MKKSCTHQSRGRISNKFIWPLLFLWVLLWYHLHEQRRTLPQCEWTNDGKSKTVGYGYIGYNMEREAAHSSAERTVWKDILEGTKGKKCYGSTFVCLDRYHLARDRIRGKKRQHFEKKTQETALENGNNSGINQDKTSWRETLHCHGTLNCSHSIRKQGRNKICVFFSNCKTKKKKLDEHSNKTNQLQLV